MKRRLFEKYCTVCGDYYVYVQQGKSSRERHEKTRKHREANAVHLGRLLSDEIQNANPELNNTTKDDDRYVKCSGKDLRIAICWIMEAFREHFEEGNENIPEFFPSGLALNIGIREAQCPEWAVPEEDVGGECSPAGSGSAVASASASRGPSASCALPATSSSSTDAEVEMFPAYCRQIEDFSPATVKSTVEMTPVKSCVAPSPKRSTSPATVTLDCGPSQAKVTVDCGVAPAKVTLCQRKTSTDLTVPSVRSPTKVTVHNSRSPTKFTIQQCRSLAKITLHHHCSTSPTKVTVRNSETEAKLVLHSSKSTTKVTFQKKYPHTKLKTFLFTAQGQAASHCNVSPGCISFVKGASAQNTPSVRGITPSGTPTSPSTGVMSIDDASPVSAISIRDTSSVRDTASSTSSPGSVANGTQNDMASTSDCAPTGGSITRKDTSLAQPTAKADASSSLSQQPARPAAHGPRLKVSRREVPAIPYGTDIMYVWAHPLMVLVLRQMKVLQDQLYQSFHRFLVESHRLDLEDRLPPAGQGVREIMPGFSESIRKHMLRDCQDYHRAGTEARHFFTSHNRLKYHVTAMHADRKAYRCGRQAGVDDLQVFHSEYWSNGFLYRFLDFGPPVLEMLDVEAAEPEMTHTKQLFDRLCAYDPRYRNPAS